jgi:hypothetical protein
LNSINLIVGWTPESAEAADIGLAEEFQLPKSCLSYSSELVKKTGASEEESIMVAGFAVGIVLI